MDAHGTAVVLTALPLEYRAFRAHLTDTETHIDAEGTRYEIGKLGDGIRVVLALMGMGNLTAAVLTARAIADFDPPVLIAYGVAGGLTRDAGLGDVVVATRVSTFQGGRESDDEFRPRPRGWPLSHYLEQAAHEVALAGRWIDPPAPRVHFSPMVSGDIVLDSRTSPHATLIARHYGDAVAVDMESAGVAEAAHRRDFYRTVMIRGISDLADGAKRDSDRAGWQPRAAANAAAFSAALIEVIARRPGRPPVPGPASVPVPPSPFRGLSAFRESDAGLYFGRVESVDLLAGLVGRRRLVAVAGRSGCGKSSLLHAGLVPRMRGRGWTIVPVRPAQGVPAATVLAGALLAVLRRGLSPAETLTERAALATAVSEGRLAEIVAQLGDRPVLVTVDQFEEHLRGDLAALLALLATAHGVHVVLTLRTDTLDAAAAALGTGLGDGVFLVPPMRPDELRAAIESPVANTGVRFEPGLVERIALAGAEEPGTLPLIQFTLTRLWDEQRDGRLTHAAYDGFGGVAGALAFYAEEVWKRDLDDDERVRARRLLTQLVRPGEGDGEDVVRRTARGSDLDPALVPVAGELATARLVVTGTDAAGEPTVDLAHAALGRHWQRLRDWLAEEREFRTWQEDLRVSMRRDEQLRGDRLAAALRWRGEHPQDITAAEARYIAGSRSQARRRWYAWRAAFAAIVALMLLAGGFAVAFQSRSVALTEQLRVDAGRLLVAQAREVAPRAPDTAALYSIAAWQADPDAAIGAYLAGEYLRNRRTERLDAAGVGEILRVEASADGRLMAAVGRDGASFWGTDQPGAGPQPLPAGTGRVTVSGDGRLIAYSGTGGRVEVRAPDGAVTPLFEGGEDLSAASTLRFDATGRRLLAVLPRSPERVRVWDVARRTPVSVPSGVQNLTGFGVPVLGFGPDRGGGADSLILANGEKLQRWRLPDGQVTDIETVGPPYQAAVSGSGTTVVSCDTGGPVVYDLVGMRLVGPRPVDADCPPLLNDVLDHHGHFVVLTGRAEGDADRPLRVHPVLDLRTGVVARMAVPTDATPPAAPRATATGLVGAQGASAYTVRAGAFDEQQEPLGAAGTTVASRDQPLATTVVGGKLRLWDPVRNTVLGETPADEQVLWFAPDGRRLLTGNGKQRQLIIRELPSLRETARLPLPDRAVAQPGGIRNLFGPLADICVVDLASAGTVAVVLGGVVTRLDLSGTDLGDPLRLDRADAPLTRLTELYSCASPAGRDQIAIDVGRNAELWDLATGRYLATFPTAVASGIRDLRFSPDGRLLAVLGGDGTLQVWDVEQRRRVHGPYATVRPDGLDLNRLAGFAGPDRVVVRTSGRIEVWSLTRDALLAAIDLNSRWVGLRPDAIDVRGEAGFDSVPLDERAWVAHLCRVVGRDVTGAERAAMPAGGPTGPVCPPV